LYPERPATQGVVSGRNSKINMLKLNKFFIFLVGISVFSQEIVLPPAHIKSIQIIASEGSGFVPIIQKSGSIELSFDDLEADEKDYYYLIEHCDRNWKTSDLLPTEFVRGYQKEQIRNFDNSFNTLQNFTHYALNIPNEQSQILISGNYRLSILNDDEEVVFTRYFIVYELVTSVGVSVHQSREVSFINSHQSVQFIINHTGLTINNPQEEIFPVIYQNFDFSTQISGLKPQFMRNDQLLYKYDQETAYLGGNEFLNFDTKEMLMTNMNVASVISGKDLYESILYPDIPRAYDPYTYYPDINGAFVIRKARVENSNIEADYSYVNFSLTIPEIMDKKVYVYGGFNNFQLTDENLMEFNPLTQSYEAEILLKQGFYNYNYITLNTKNQIDTTEINGSFYETENEYQVVVYYSKFGSKYDRVIGYGVGSSLNMLR
jgi:hypothetical protein